ncbi:Predicted ATPase [Serratia fonticola]|uniref:Predicted ATPase n=1 Tax=Serratia fonticola TaxID=47917 RepID=A0A4U9WJE0_SERFO|nr:Predicted ATPase [Serratia fonticola]
MFAATKADHITADQHANLVSLLQQLVQEAWQNAAFEGISMDCVGLAFGTGDRKRHCRSSWAADPGIERPPSGRWRTADGLPWRSACAPAWPAFWQQQGFHFDQFRPRMMSVDSPLPHIRLDAVMEFLLGDKLR